MSAPPTNCRLCKLSWTTPKDRAMAHRVAFNAQGDAAFYNTAKDVIMCDGAAWPECESCKERPAMPDHPLCERCSDITNDSWCEPT